MSSTSSITRRRTSPLSMLSRSSSAPDRCRPSVVRRATDTAAMSMGVDEPEQPEYAVRRPPATLFERTGQQRTGVDAASTNRFVYSVSALNARPASTSTCFSTAAASMSRSGGRGGGVRARPLPCSAGSRPPHRARPAAPSPTPPTESAPASRECGAGPRGLRRDPRRKYASAGTTPRRSRRAPCGPALQPAVPQQRHQRRDEQEVAAAERRRCGPPLGDRGSSSYISGTSSGRNRGWTWPSARATSRRRRRRLARFGGQPVQRGLGASRSAARARASATAAVNTRLESDWSRYGRISRPRLAAKLASARDGRHAHVGVVVARAPLNVRQPALGAIGRVSAERAARACGPPATRGTAAVA